MIGILSVKLWVPRLRSYCEFLCSQGDIENLDAGLDTDCSIPNLNVRRLE